MFTCSLFPNRENVTNTIDNLLISFSFLLSQIVSSSKKSPSFDIKAPIIDVPPVHLPAPNISLSHQTATSSETIQTQSDSGLDQITSSHIQASSTLGEIPQLPSLSSGFGSEILESMTTKGYSLPDIELPEPTLVPKYSSKSDLTRQINPNHEIRTKFIARQNDIKTALATEIPKSLDQFNATTDSSTLDKILTNSIDLIKDKKVSTYAELHDKLHVEHQQQIHLINPVVHSLYYIMENHGLDNLDKPEFPLTIRDVSTMINDVLLFYIRFPFLFLSFSLSCALNRWHIFRPNRHLTQ